MKKSRKVKNEIQIYLFPKLFSTKWWSTVVLLIYHIWLAKIITKRNLQSSETLTLCHPLTTRQVGQSNFLSRLWRWCSPTVSLCCVCHWHDVNLSLNLHMTWIFKISRSPLVTSLKFSNKFYILSFDGSSGGIAQHKQPKSDRIINFHSQVVDLSCVTFATICRQIKVNAGKFPHFSPPTTRNVSNIYHDIENWLVLFRWLGRTQRNFSHIINVWPDVCVFLSVVSVLICWVLPQVLHSFLFLSE